MKKSISLIEFLKIVRFIGNQTRTKLDVVTKIFLSIAIISIVTLVNAQENIDSSYCGRPRNDINLNLLGGDGSFISINYDRLFLVKRNFFLAGKVGFGYSAKLTEYITAIERDYWGLCHQITTNLGQKMGFFEIGFGGSLIFDKNVTYYGFYGTAGFRLQPIKSGKLIFRVFASLPFAGYNIISFMPIGISLGVCF